MKRCVLCFILVVWTLQAQSAEPLKPNLRAKPTAARASEWDKNGDGKLDASERKALSKSLTTGAQTNSASVQHLANTRPQKGSPRPGRLTTRIQRALNGK